MKETFGRQLQEICVQLDQGDLKEARQGAEIMQEELNRTKTEQYCSNPIVNAVLSEKESVCRELGFSMDIQVQIPKGVEVAPLHLCSIFSNLLDNAIEAVRELEQGKRIIEVSGGLKGYYLLVKVSNTAREAHVGRKKRKGRGFKKG